MIVPYLMRNLYEEKLDGFIVWFLEFCYKNRMPMISEIYFKDIISGKIANLSAKYHVSPEEFEREFEIYYFDDSKDDPWPSRTGYFVNRFVEGNRDLESFLNGVFDQIETNGHIEGLLIFCETPQVLKKTAMERNYVCINIEASVIRKYRGFTQSLFWANTKGKLYGATECRDRYSRFLSENIEFPLFSREELIALMEVRENLGLIPFLNAEPQFEMGICGQGYAVVPYLFLEEAYTDDDLYMECGKYYKNSELSERKHAGHYSELENLENRGDAQSFILRNRRICAVASNTLVMAMLWNRTACCNNNLLSCSFACEKDFTSTNVVDLRFLNWLLLCCFVPEEYTFDYNYWKWRISQPAEREIYDRHLESFLKNNGLDWDFFRLNKEERLSSILKWRNLDSYEIDSIVSPADKKKAIVNDCMVSVMRLSGAEHYVVNRLEGDRIVSESVFDRFPEKMETELLFLPLRDLAGFVRINSVDIIDGESNEILFSGNNEMRYIPKDYSFKYRFDCDKRKLKCTIVWEYVSIIDEIQQKNYRLEAQDKSADYVFPFEIINYGERIIVYGAGKVGQFYMQSNNSISYFTPVLWVDKNAEKLRERGFWVHGADKMKTVNYDKVLIAVEKAGLAEEIKRELSDYGIPPDRIIWRNPKSTGVKI